MKFICMKEDLIQGLSIATKASASRSPQQVLECVSISADATGVHLMCTDLQMGIVTDVPATVAQDGRVLLNARLLNEIVRKLPDGEVTISIGTTHRATIFNCILKYYEFAIFHCFCHILKLHTKTNIRLV